MYTSVYDFRSSTSTTEGSPNLCKFDSLLEMAERASCSLSVGGFKRVSFDGLIRMEAENPIPDPARNDKSSGIFLDILSILKMAII